MNLKIEKFTEISGTVKAPSSKSYSHRAVILASLASGTTKIYDILPSEDVLSTIHACRLLGAEINQKEDYLEVIGTSGKIHNLSSEPINLGNSGTTLRILTSVAALSDNEVTFTGDDSLKTRPMGPLLRALKPLGVNILSNNTKAPLTIKPGFNGGETVILGNTSSQFISSMLIAAPLSKKGLSLQVYPEFVSKPYVDMTLSVMEHFGVRTTETEYTKHENCQKEVKDCFGEKFEILPQSYIAKDYTVEGDYSSASYLLAACAIAGGEVTIRNLFKNSKQGDKLILEILDKMGCNVYQEEDSVTISSEGDLKAIEIDLSNAPDLLLTVAVLATLAEGTSKINGVKHARVKETDRISCTFEELNKLGCNVYELEDGLIIEGNTISNGIVDSHNDHRIAMAFSLLGLKHDVEVVNGECFNISFPNFIEALSEIGVDLCLE